MRVSGVHQATIQRDGRGYVWVQPSVPPAPPVVVSPEVRSVVTRQERPRRGSFAFDAGVQGPNVAPPPQIADSAITRQRLPDHPLPFIRSSIHFSRPPVTDYAFTVQSRPGLRDIQPVLFWIRPDNTIRAFSELNKVITRQEQPWQPLWPRPPVDWYPPITRGRPALAFASDLSAVICQASDSPSGQNWRGDGYMAKYEIDTSIQLECTFIDALNNIYVDPTTVQLFVSDPGGNQTQYSTQNGVVTKSGTGHYFYTLEGNKAGTWTYKWRGTGTYLATSPDQTFDINATGLSI